MLNVLKMDLYRLSRTKSAWLILALGIAFSFFSVFMIKSDINNMKKDAEYLQEIQNDYDYVESKKAESTDDSVTVRIGYIVNTNPDWIKDDYKISVWDLFNVNAASNTYLMFIGIAVAIFVYAEHKNGYIKGLAGLLPSRRGLALSKFISTVIYTLIYFGIIIISTAVASLFLFGYINFGEIKKFIPTTLTLILLHIAFTVVIASLTIISNSSGFSVFVTTAASAGLIETFCAFLDFALKHFCKVPDKFNTTQCIISGNISVMSVSPTEKDFIRSIIVSAVYIVVFAVLGMNVMKKRDVK